MIKNILNKILGKDKFNSKKYWENRYASGGNSGDGSYGRLSQFKAAYLNKFITDNNIQSAIEIGCGDGNQLSIINYPSYTGLDVSSTIIEKCKQKFEKDSTKNFLLYKPEEFQPDNTLQAELALSLDVLYHIVEEKKYLKYLNDLFAMSYKFVIVYSTNFNHQEAQHVLHRKFTDDIDKLFKNWKLREHQKNPFPGNGEQESMADFFIYQHKDNNA